MHIKNTVHSTMKNELEQAGTTWNEMGPTKNSLSQTHTHTHTHTHNIIQGHCVCSIIAQQNTTLPDAYLEPSGTSTLGLFNYFAKMLHHKCSTGF